MHSAFLCSPAAAPLRERRAGPHREVTSGGQGKRGRTAQAVTGHLMTLTGRPPGRSAVQPQVGLAALQEGAASMMHQWCRQWPAPRLLRHHSNQARLRGHRTALAEPSACACTAAAPQSRSTSQRSTLHCALLARTTVCCQSKTMPLGSSAAQIEVPDAARKRCCQPWEAGRARCER